MSAKPPYFVNLSECDITSFRDGVYTAGRAECMVLESSKVGRMVVRIDVMKKISVVLRT